MFSVNDPSPLRILQTLWYTYVNIYRVLAYVCRTWNYYRGTATSCLPVIRLQAKSLDETWDIDDHETEQNCHAVKKDAISSVANDLVPLWTYFVLIDCENNQFIKK